MQRIIVSGNLTQDAEVKKLEKSTVVKFTVAENSNDYKNEAGEKVAQPEYFDCELWRKNDSSSKLDEFLKKGKSVSVVAKKKTTSYEKDGQTRYSTVFTIDEISLN